jgi:hypothetical protein
MTDNAEIVRLMQSEITTREMGLADLRKALAVLQGGASAAATGPLGWQECLPEDSPLAGASARVDAPEAAPAPKKLRATSKRSSGPKAAASYDDIVAAVIEQGERGMNAADIVRTFRLSVSQVRVALRALQKSGRIRSEGKNRGTRYFAAGGEGVASEAAE